MHLFLVTQYYPPEIGAAASRWGDYVKLLIKKGHKVTVLCQTPNYPSGTIFDGYKNKWFNKNKLSENLTIIRSGVWVNNRSSKIKLLGSYLTFALIGIINSTRVKDYDLVIVSSPPLFVGLIGIFLKKFKKSTLLLDLRDIWPESVVALSGLKTRWLIKFGRLLEAKLYNTVDGYIFPVPGFLNYFKKSFPEELKKPMFNLMNGINEEFLQNGSKVSLPKNYTFNVLYVGNMGKAQGLDIVIETAKKLVGYPIHFRFIGEGTKKEELIDLAQKKGLENVFFDNALPRLKLIQEIKKSNVCLVPLLKNNLFELAIPSKIFEIMACSKPIILGVKGEAEKFISNNNCGIIVEPENSDDFKNAILSYFNNKDMVVKHGENGVNYVTNNMQKEYLLSEFLFQLNNEAKELSLNINT
jgi:glycosyltransferase involved in cell wall biosynthesis